MVQTQDPGDPERGRLPFSGRRQKALLGHLLSDEQFFLQAHGRLRGIRFDDPVDDRVWAAKIRFHDKYRRPGSVEELKGSVEFNDFDNAARIAAFKSIDLGVELSRSLGLDQLRAELTTWLKAKVVKGAYERIGSLWALAERNSERMDDVFRAFHEGAERLKQTSFEIEEQVVRFDDIADGTFLAEQEAELEGACTFGCPQVDRNLVRGCHNDNGLLRGDHTTILAGTNVGKTTAICTVMGANVRRQRSVLVVTHEGRWRDIKSKMVCTTAGIDPARWRTLVTTPEGQQFLKVVQQLLERYLTYIPINKTGLTVEDVMSTVRRFQEQRIADHGVGYDMLANDYPARLTTVLASKGHWPRRQIDEFVYNEFSQIGLELEMHVLDAIQANREGNKVTKGLGGVQRPLTVEDVAESFGPMQTATNVMSWNRSPLDEKMQRGTWHCCKSRSNEKNWSVVTKTNYACATTHSPDLPATFYKGSGLLDEAVVDELLQRYAGMSVPETYFVY